jgi:hypothetical protein
MADANIGESYRDVKVKKEGEEVLKILIKIDSN